MIPTHDTERRRRFLISAAYLAVLAGVVILFFRRLLPLLAPFLAAWLFAELLAPLARRLTVRLHIRYALAAGLCLLLFFALLGALLVLAAGRLLALLSAVLWRLPALYGETVAPAMETLFREAEALAARLGPEAAALAERALPALASSAAGAVTEASVKLMSALSGALAHLPGCLFSGAICVIATVFLTLDLHRVNAFLLGQLPQERRRLVLEIRAVFADTLRRYGRSYGRLLGLTFLELLAGLCLLGQKSAPLLAAGIALFDILPVVGAGTVLLPWSALTLLSGRTGKGLGLLALYLAMLTVRQFLEPRILGRETGLHPLVTLAAMFVGWKLFGAPGLMGLPLLCAVGASLDGCGVLRLLRRGDDRRPDTAPEKSAEKTAEDY